MPPTGADLVRARITRLLNEQTTYGRATDHGTHISFELGENMYIIRVAPAQKED